jgi:ribosomal protein L44E
MEPKHITRLCDECRLEFTFVQAGPGQPRRYCSEACKKTGQNALAATRKHKQRIKQGKAQAQRDLTRGRHPIIFT